MKSVKELGPYLCHNKNRLLNQMPNDLFL